MGRHHLKFMERHHLNARTAVVRPITIINRLDHCCFRSLLSSEASKEAESERFLRLLMELSRAVRQPAPATSVSAVHRCTHSINTKQANYINVKPVRSRIARMYAQPPSYNGYTYNYQKSNEQIEKLDTVFCHSLLLLLLLLLLYLAVKLIKWNSSVHHIIGSRDVSLICLNLDPIDFIPLYVQ